MTQKEALNILKSGRNVYLTGAAGSGKTYVLNEYIKYLKDHGVGVAVTASTGIAATHLGGMTIHSWSGIGIKDNLSEYEMENLIQREYLWKRYSKTKVLVIDEISMINPKMFDSLNEVAKMMKRDDKVFGGMQVVLSGDFFQLPPVMRDGEKIMYIDKSDTWKKMDIRVCYLDGQYRQADLSLENILNEIREGEISDETREKLEKMVNSESKLKKTPTRLYTHNFDVDSVNETELKKLPGDLFEYEMKTRGRANLVATLCKSILAPEILRLKKNAVVMFVKNNFEEGYVNGTLGKVIDFDRDVPIVETYSGKRIYVTNVKWQVEDDGKVLASAEQLPLRLAWAITVHKSQGMSLDSAEIDLSKAFVPGQGYVALSRLRNLSGLNLIGLNEMALLVDPYILELNKWLVRESIKWSKVITKFNDDGFKEMRDDFISRAGGTNDPEKIKQNKELKAESMAPKIPTHEKTLALLKENKSLKEMAKLRGVTIGTIISHLEKLKDSGHDLDLKLYKPKSADLKIIKKAFKELKDTKLAPVFNKLGGEYSYDELRLARLFL